MGESRGFGAFAALVCVITAVASIARADFTRELDLQLTEFGVPAACDTLQPVRGARPLLLALPAEGIDLDLAALPPAFCGTLLGAQARGVGTLHDDHLVLTGEYPAPLREGANLLFSSAAGPSALAAPALIGAYRLAGGGLGGDGGLDVRRRRLRVPLRSDSIGEADPGSLQSWLGGDDFAGGLPFSTSVPLDGAGALLPVYGAVDGYGPPSGPAVTFGRIGALRLSPDGQLSRAFE